MTAIVDDGEDVLVPSPTYPLYTAVLAKIGANPVYYRTDPAQGWLPDLDHLARAVTPKTRALVLIDPNNPTGAVYPEAVRRQLVDLAESRGLVILADEVYGDLGFDGAVPALAAMAPEAAIISYSSLSKAYLAPGWRAGWMAVGSTPRLDGALAAIKKLADGRLCSPGPMQYAVTAALTGDRSHQVTFRHGAARARRADGGTLQRHAGDDGRGAASGVLRDAAGDAAARARPTKTSCSACCAPGASCACTARVSACRPTAATSASCSSPRRPSWAPIYDDVADYVREFVAA